MQPLPREEALAGLESQAPDELADLAETESSFQTYAGLLLATALGLYSWAALLLLIRWVF